MAKKFRFLIQIIISCVFLWGCTSNNPNELRQWLRPDGKIKVLCTIAMIEDLVKQIGGEYVDTLTLVKGGLDPHTYQLVKGDNEKLTYANLIFYNGLGLEHGPSLRHYLAENDKAVGLGDRIRSENPSLFLYYNGNVDPHIWMDSSLWSMTIPYIVEALEQQDSAYSSIYRKNGEKLRQELLGNHRRSREEMLKIPESKRFLITSHDAFNYFARAYLATDPEIKNHDWQKRFAAPEGLAPESQLSTTDIRLIIDHMRTYDIRVIFPESNVSQASIRKLLDVGEELGMPIYIASDPLYGDAMGSPGTPGDTYLKMIQHNVRTIVKHLAKNGPSHPKEQEYLK
ncbi:MAG: metal ABC transporter solute-binding protein, Zn/Mn family [Waddliaceae bacterium]